MIIILRGPAGYIPYTEWKCKSEKCFSLLQNYTGDNATFFSRNTMCSNELLADQDFVWTPTHTSFAVDWGIYCGTETQKSSINSFYFVGAFVGLIGSSTLFDLLGRKKVTLGAGFLAVFSTLGMAFAQDLWTMLGLRIVQGLGVLVAMTGRYVWIMEFTPLASRNIANVLLGVTWPMGTMVLILIAYLVNAWRTAVFVASGITFCLYCQLLFVPESARFFLQKQLDHKALKVLNKMARFYNNPPLRASCLPNQAGVQQKEDGLAKKLKDFLQYPVMLRRTIILMICWFLVSLFYYGLGFGWHKMGRNIYASQGFSCLSEMLACIVCFTLVGVVGRKKTQILAFMGIGVCFGVAMIDLNLSDTWQLSQIACLIAIIFIATEFLSVYLYTTELSPTSHRGMILSICSCTARIGSFAGPYLSHLFDYLSRRLVLGIFGGVGVLAALMTGFLLQDTSGLAIPETPADLQGRQKIQEDAEELECI